MDILEATLSVIFEMFKIFCNPLTKCNLYNKQMNFGIIHLSHTVVNT